MEQPELTLRRRRSVELTDASFRQFRSTQEAFMSVDTSGDGEISKEELTAMLRVIMEGVHNVSVRKGPSSSSCNASTPIAYHFLPSALFIA